jgi:hypothetical protein
MLTECSVDRITNLDHSRAIVTHDRLDIFFGHFSRFFCKRCFLYSLFFQTIELNELAVSIRKSVAHGHGHKRKRTTINDLITKNINLSVITHNFSGYCILCDHGS